MTPSTFTLHQKLPLPWEAAFLYVLVSRRNPGSFKLGVTSHPAMRFAGLTKRFGEFNLQASALVVAKNRRAALDLEAILESVFIAPAWRAEPPVIMAKNGRAKPSDGDTEWYNLSAFKPMVSFVTSLSEHDNACDLHRFAVVQNIEDCDLWSEHLRDLGVQTRFRAPRDVARKAQQKLAQNEARFAAVQAWMEQHRHQLVSATPFATDDYGNRRRTFVFRIDDASNTASEEAINAQWEALASSCVVSTVSERGSMSITYFGAVTAAADMSTYSVEFLLTPSFTQAADDYPSLGDLSARIENWLGALPTL